MHTAGLNRSTRQVRFKKISRRRKQFNHGALGRLATLVAVGTALASDPPHGSVREGLPHTALTSGSCDGQPLVGIRMLSLLAACRTHHKPCDSHPRLCVRHECACGAFPLVDLLPSANSAANASA